VPVIARWSGVVWVAVTDVEVQRAPYRVKGWSSMGAAAAAAITLLAVALTV
jgi:hypothetical protein